MNGHDPILAADLAEEQCAAEALRLALSKDELVSCWWRDCEHFQGEARERLREEFTDRLLSLGAVGGFN